MTRPSLTRRIVGQCVPCVSCTCCCPQCVELLYCRRRVVRCGNGFLIPAQPIAFERQTTSSRARAMEISSALIVDCAVTLGGAVFKLSRPPAVIDRYQEVDFPLSGLIPQLASQKQFRVKHPVRYVSARDIFPFRDRRRCLAAVIWSLGGLLMTRANWLTE